MNWIYEGLSEAVEQNVDGEVTGKFKRLECKIAEKQVEQENTAAGGNGMPDGKEEILGENAEYIAGEGRVRSNNMEMSTSELDSPKKSKKRKLKPTEWKRSINKKRRNMGLSYETTGKNKKQREAKKIKPTCRETCRINCINKISQEQRVQIFQSYWNLGDVDLQREYLTKCTNEIKPAYRYVREDRKRGPRGNNISYSFPVNGTLMSLQNFFHEYSRH